MCKKDHMKIRNLVAFPLLLAAAPAFATGGFSCRTTAPPGVSVTIVTGTGIPGGIALVTVREGQRLLSTGATGDPVTIGESQLDDRTLLLELLDPSDQRRVARLDARPSGEPGSRDLAGTFEFQNRTYRILCRPEH